LYTVSFLKLNDDDADERYNKSLNIAKSLKVASQTSWHLVPHHWILLAENNNINNTHISIPP